MKAVPTLHPAALMRDPTLWGVVVHDLKRAWEEAQHGTHNPEPCEYVVVDSPDKLADLVGVLDPRVGPIALDIETRGEELLCVGLCQTPPRVWVVEAPTALRCVDQLNGLFAEATVLIHNAAFDLPRLSALGFVLPRWEDTMLLHHTVYAELPHTLAFVQSVYTRLPFHKWMLKGERGDKP